MEHGERVVFDGKQEIQEFAKARELHKKKREMAAIMRIQERKSSQR
jgi:hypothetical protein